MVILDTNIIIDHLRQLNKWPTVLLNFTKANPQEVYAISIITIQELYEGQSTKSTAKANMLLATIAKIKILPYTYEIAKKAGEIARDENKDIQVADAAIAATTIINEGQLFTLNKKDFGKIKNLALV